LALFSENFINEISPINGENFGFRILDFGKKHPDPHSEIKNPKSEIA
jgi:hypothetical protein